MEFTVTFMSSDNEPLMETLGKAGIDLLDDVLASNTEFSEEDYLNINIKDECPIHGRVHKENIPLSTARKSELFGGKVDVTVLVSSSFFSKFVELDIEKFTMTTYINKRYKLLNWLRTPSTEYKDILNVRYVFNSQALLEDWEKAGFPLNWEK